MLTYYSVIMMAKKVHVAAGPAVEHTPGRVASVMVYILLLPLKLFSTLLAPHGVDRVAGNAIS
jgi:hypothetical protein